jgi:hypothetical protein
MVYPSVLPEVQITILMHKVCKNDATTVDSQAILSDYKGVFG